MSADTKGFVMTECKDAFKMAGCVVNAIQNLMSQVNYDWRACSIIQRAMGEPLQFTEPEITLATFAEMLMVNFIFNGEDRTLYIHFNCDVDGEDCGYKDGAKLILSLGAWGSSVEIMHAVLDSLKHLGDAYLIENDCADYQLIKV